MSASGDKTAAGAARLSPLAARIGGAGAEAWEIHSQAVRRQAVPGVLFHEVLDRAKGGNYRVNLIEAYDQPWKRWLEVSTPHENSLTRVGS